MTQTETKNQNEKLQFTWMEFSGSLGDLGLFIPLVVAMCLSGGFDIGIVLILAGVMNVLTGWFFRQPIPVQPMKAIAVIVITEGMVRQEIIAAGMIIGALLIVSSVFIQRVERWIPKPVVRGIQLGIGLKLAAKGAGWIGALPMIGWDSILASCLVICMLLFLLYYRQPALVFIFLLGLVFLYLDQPLVFSNLRITWPKFVLVWPSSNAWGPGFLKGVIPQMPLTILNSVIALCALSREYFPGRGASPKKIAASVGVMNLACVPLGGIPMCHGAGGLAAQYSFGARSGGSVIILGCLKIFAGIFFGGALISLLQNYPVAVLGPMLLFAGVELAKSSKDIIPNTRHLSVGLLTAACILGVNTWVGLIAGCGLAMAYRLAGASK